MAALTRISILFLFTALVLAVYGTDDVEFNHPSILPEFAENFRRDKESSRKSNYVTKERLPPNLYALAYDLWFKPYFPVDNGPKYDGNRNFTFDGRMSMSAEATKDSDRFVLNAYNFKIQSYKVTDFTDAVIPIARIEQNDNLQQLTLYTDGNLVKAGTIYNIAITYTGLINSYENGGVFYTSYTDANQNIHFMIATHMEPFAARTVFPCLDEPSYKATFAISLEYPSSLVALSNMKETAPVDLGNGYSSIVFKESLQMSTYLVAFAVGPYVSKEYVNKHGTTARAWGWTGTEQYLDFAAKNSGECLYQLGEYTGIKFPMEKADQLGLPQFPAGAMENWGLIIYKYQYIAYNPQTMTTTDMQNAAKVMCHELAHQWFGDLVTTAWWDDLFLNEGFADYFMRYIQTFVYPEQAKYLDTLAIYDELEVGMNADILNSAHPLVDPNGPSFDDITYNKGASMLRMMSDVLGADVFRKGIQKYLNQRAYDNAVDEDLFSALTSVAKDAGIEGYCGAPLNMSEFMGPYVHQTNYPLIRYINNDIEAPGTASIEPFRDSTNLSPTPWNYTWTVPLRINTYLNPKPVLHWIPPTGYQCPNKAQRNESASIKKPKNRVAHWEIADVTSATYGRVIYDDIGFDRLMKNIRIYDISDNLKISLLADEAAYSARERDAGRPWNLKRFFDLCNNIFNQASFLTTPSYSVFQQAFPTIEYASRTYRDSVEREFSTRLWNKLFLATYVNRKWQDTGSWDEDTFTESFLPFAVRNNIGDVENKTMTMFAQVKSACSGSTNGSSWCNPFSTNIRRAIYCGATKYAPVTSDYFFQVLHFYNTEVVTNPYFYQEYYALLEGLSCTQTPATLKTVIRLYLNSPINKARVFGWLKYNPAASDAMFDYLNTFPDQVLNSSALDAYVDAMTYNWGTYERNYQLGTYINNHQLTNQQYNIFDVYYQRIRSQWLDYQTVQLSLHKWMYDNLVVIGKVPWNARVEGTIKPLFYDLFISPVIPSSLEVEWNVNLTFTATSLMTFELLYPADTIQLNAHRLIFNDVTIFSTNTGKDVPLEYGWKITKQLDDGMIYVRSNGTKLLPGTFKIKFNYLGFIFDQPNEGVAANTNLYSYNDKKGWIFTTDFEGGPGARSLFPCIDEPAYKAQFNIKVKHPADMTALSNSLEVITEYDGAYATTTFDTTETMSTYLVAICVGHFSHISKLTPDHILVRMWSWTGMEVYGEFALDIATGTVQFMSKYFEFEYPIAKLDIMALPQYTQNAGAMENFGLIIGEYQQFMLDKDYATTEIYANVAETASHEVVHQWFGDLVSIDWWSDIFLNEGFAQYWFANGINYTLPQQQEYVIDFNRFMINKIALEVDCIPGYAKPVISNQQPVFGVEPYYKGSALLNLLSNVLTPEVLQEGLQLYIRKNPFGTANATDLWEQLTIAAQLNNLKDWNKMPMNVANFMNPYTLQVSYPVLVLEAVGTQTVKATQTSCMANGGNLWNVPVFTQNPNGESFNWFIGTDGGNAAVWTRSVASPYRVDNARSSSFMRVQYDTRSWISIVQQLNNNLNVFAPTTRAEFLDDARFFFESGRWPITRWLDLSLYLGPETSIIPWKQASDFLTMLLNRFRYQPEYATIQNYVQNITYDAYTKFGWYIRDDIWAKNRLANIITELACKSGSPRCLNGASSLYEQFRVQCQFSNYGTGRCAGIAPDLRRTAYCYGLQQAPREYQSASYLYEWFVHNTQYFDLDKDNLIHAFGCIEEPTTQAGIISWGLEEYYPAVIFDYIGQNDKTGLGMYYYFLQATDQVLTSEVSFAQYMEGMTMYWSTPSQLKLLDDFRNDPDRFNQLNQQQKAQYNSAYQLVLDNQRWMDKNKAIILNWIQTNFGTAN